MIDTSKYLPLGSIVQLDDYEDNIMIMGYMPYGTAEGKKVCSDYSGIKVNEGYNYENAIMFNKDNISNVIFVGYKNEMIINRLKLCDELLKSLRSNNKEESIDNMINGLINKKTSSNVSNEIDSLIAKNNKEKSE